MLFAFELVVGKVPIVDGIPYGSLAIFPCNTCAGFEPRPCKHAIGGFNCHCSIVGRLREAEACSGGSHYPFRREVSAVVCCRVPSMVHPRPYIEGVRKMSGKTV